MPHIVLEYSSDLAESTDFEALLGKLHRALGDTEEFETDRIKSRAVPLDDYLVAGGRGHAFVHATVAFSPGRPDACRKELGRRLLAILADEARSPELEITRSVEIRQFEPGMYFTHRDGTPAPRMRPVM